VFALHTVLGIAAGAATGQLAELANRSALTRWLVQPDRERQSFALAIVNFDWLPTTHQCGYRIGDQLLVGQVIQLCPAGTAGQHGTRPTAGAAVLRQRRGLPALPRPLRDTRPGAPAAGQR